MPPQHRRAGFRVTLGAVAETDGSVPSGKLAAPVIVGEVLVTEAPIPLLNSGVETERRSGERRRSLPPEAAAELVPPEGDRRRGERRKRASA